MSDAKVFDLKAALAGRTYPETDIPVFLDEACAFRLAELTRAVDHDPANAELEAERQSYIDTLGKLVIQVHLKGVPRHVRESIEARVDKAFPATKDWTGHEERSDEHTRAYIGELWDVYVVKITAPDGSEVVPSKEDLSEFRRTAPDASVAAVTSGIFSMIKDAEIGYEQGVQGLSFLSRPSPEE